MELTHWLSLLAVCVLGAMSPGPSLGVIIQIAVRQGRSQGVIASVGHGLGVGFYALLTALGLSVLITESPTLFLLVKVLGALFLLYLGFVTLKKNGQKAGASQQPSSPVSTNSFVIGFLTAALNPKLLIFFLALFSQFVRNEAQLLEKLLMAATVMVVDIVWYMLVSLLVSNAGIIARFSFLAGVMKTLFGLLLIGVAIEVLWSLL